MAGDLAREDAIFFAHPPLDERMTDTVHERSTAVPLDDVLHRAARPQVVDDGGAGLLQQKCFGEERRDEITGHELARAVDEEAAVRITVPCDADIRSLTDNLLRDVAAVLLNERIGLVVRKRTVDVETQLRRLARQLIEQKRCDEARHPAAGVEDDSEWCDHRRIDE